MSVRYLSCGDTAFTVEFGNEISPEINGRVMALHAAIGVAREAGEISGVVETVPTMRSLMVTYDPLSTSRADLQPQVDALIARGLPVDAKNRLVTVPCCYDDPEFAPDLAEVAERTKKTPEQVVAAHLASPFKVYVLGFMPGLAYVAGLDQSKLPASTSRAMRSKLFRSIRSKVSESPGERNTGCSRRWSNIQSGVRPIRCQPPGLSNG